jgi:hypothetical protein
VTRDGERVRRDDDEPQNFVTIPIPREGEIYLRYGPADSSAVSRRPGIQDTPACSRATTTRSTNS